jgi:hypothetical protein
MAPPTTATAAASGTLSLSPGSTAWAKLSGARTSSLASVDLTVPAAFPLELGLQVRGTRSRGYRTMLGIAADGAITASFARVSSGTATALATPTALGISVTPGQVLHLQAAVVGKSTVKLYLRAWKDGTARPATWQLVARDSSSKRFARGGSTYLWARVPASLAATRLAWRGASVRAYTAAKAAAVGVAAPGAPTPTPTPSPTAPAPSPTDTPSPTATATSGNSPAGTDDDTFGLAVIPDTQAETNVHANTPFLNRVNWMVANKAAFDLRYVLHTGDMTNWGWLDLPQLTRARAAMDVLKNNGLPYALTIGNHDTRAVGWDGVSGSTGYGGSAYMYNPECPTRLPAADCKSWLLVRHTEEFNQYFPLSGMSGVGGAFEAGKADTYFTTFTANNTKWLVLTLELWPRAEAVAWAKNVVATHPDHNVIIQTHSYLNGDATVSSSNGGYGSNSPKYIYDNIVSKYPNVKLVFSGHVGGFASRSDAPNGNTVVSYLGNDMGGPTYNPVRVLQINTATGQVTSSVYDPIRGDRTNSTSHTIQIIH